LAAIESETHQHAQDRFQARVCAGWLLWALRDYPAALARLPDPGADDEEGGGLLNNNNCWEWTKVCALKAAYLRANCLACDGQRIGALAAFETALPGLGSVWAAGAGSGAGGGDQQLGGSSGGVLRKQTRYWAELFLTEYCMLYSQAVKEGVRSLVEDGGDCLACFRTWARYWTAAGGSVAVGGGYGFRGSVPRRQVWAEYYAAVSLILQRGLPFPTGYAVGAWGGWEGRLSSAKSQLRAEMKRVETVYQGLLFAETAFPKADEERVEVEDFVERMMQNWAILNGRGWKEADLGAGGRASLCRGTLDTLYAAAAKTYHSTAILRHLFTVHLAVAEFDLAFMSFDSWFELVKKGRARVEKTGRPEPALDDDATVLETVSACIAALCRYGGREAAEKARHLGGQLEDMVGKLERKDSNGAANGASKDKVPPSTLAVAWQSIGLAHAQWARMTYESETRASIQEKAIQCLRKSLAPEYGNPVDVRGVFALGLLYAEQRKLSASIELVKSALLVDKAADDSQELLNGPYWRERSLIPLWHLLALMLSARQEYLMAARACEGAIEQFKDPHVLFGSRHLNPIYRSEHLNDAEAKGGKAGGDGIVDEMDDYEKEGILQIKMTQLTILELIEGPAVAVNASTELLTLYPRLFGDPEQKLELDSKPEPPKTSATLRSLRGSVFGSRSDKTSHPRQSVLNNNTEKLATIPSRPQTTQTAQSVATTTLTLQPSSEQSVDPHSSRRSMKSESVKGRTRNSLRKRDRSGSRQRALSSGGPPIPPLEGDRYLAMFDASTPTPATLSHGDSNGTSRSGPAGMGVGLVGSSFVPLLPYVQFPQEHTNRRRKAILVKVWLVIAGFYRRAGLPEDSRKAIVEAQKIVQSLETDVVNDPSGSLPVRQAGWGAEKSVEEVWADVWAEVGPILRRIDSMKHASRGLILTYVQKGNLSLALEKWYQARNDFETALTHFPDHPGAIVGLSNILMDIYSEKLLPPPAVPGLDLDGLSLNEQNTPPGGAAATMRATQQDDDKLPSLPSEPLGLGPTRPAKTTKKKAATSTAGEATNGCTAATTTTSALLGPQLPPPHLATSLPLNDRLAARDRAYGLLSGLTRLGSGWNYSDAWLALGRAYEESGQVEKARDALWWCVELEDGRGVRDWGVVAGGYVLG
jgi:tetratricopeptide (TPR) repeat protein